MTDGWLWSPLWIHGVRVMSAVGLLAALLFVVDYQRRVGFGWWRHADGEPNLTGRWLMVWGISRVLILGLALANWLAGPWPGMYPVSFVVMAVFALHTFVPYRLLAKAQEERAPTEEEHRDHVQR